MDWMALLETYGMATVLVIVIGWILLKEVWPFIKNIFTMIVDNWMESIAATQRKTEEIQDELIQIIKDGSEDRKQQAKSDLEARKQQAKLDLEDRKQLGVELIIMSKGIQENTIGIKQINAKLDSHLLNKKS